MKRGSAESREDGGAQCAGLIDPPPQERCIGEANVGWLGTVASSRQDEKFLWLVHAALVLGLA